MVRSILDVLGHRDAEPAAEGGLPGNGQEQAPPDTADDAITEPTSQLAGRNIR